MIVVAGRRIGPETLPKAEGLEVSAYVRDLYRHLAACDLAVAHEGLTTAMEMTASKRPFLYFPLRHHFEQNPHVRHRLGRYRAGRCMDFGNSPPATIAAAIAPGGRPSVRPAPFATRSLISGEAGKTNSPPTPAPSRPTRTAWRGGSCLRCQCGPARR